MVIDCITYESEGKSYKNLGEYLKLNPRSFMHISVGENDKKVILPNAHLMVFEKNFENSVEAEMNKVRTLLTPITVKVDCRDIYDNEFTIERNLSWFSRHFTVEVDGD